MKRITVFFLFGVGLCFVSCNSRDESAVPPANVLPREKMVEIMVDVNLAESALNLNFANDDKIRNTKEYDDVFKRKKIDKKQYDESLKYYTEHPDEMIKMYDEVLNELSRMQAKAVNSQQDTAARLKAGLDKHLRSIPLVAKKNN